MLGTVGRVFGSIVNIVQHVSPARVRNSISRSQGTMEDSSLLLPESSSAQQQMPASTESDDSIAARNHARHLARQSSNMSSQSLFPSSQPPLRGSYDRRRNNKDYDRQRDHRQSHQWKEVRSNRSKIGKSGGKGRLTSGFSGPLARNQRSKSDTGRFDYQQNNLFAHTRNGNRKRSRNNYGRRNSDGSFF